MRVGDGEAEAEPNGLGRKCLGMLHHIVTITKYPRKRIYTYMVEVNFDLRAMRKRH